MRISDSSKGFRLALIISSIALLIILQGFWLASSYESAYIGYRRETSSILRSTVFTLRDSMFEKNIVYLTDSFPLAHDPKMVRDSLPDSVARYQTIIDRVGIHNLPPKGSRLSASLMRMESPVSDSDVVAIKLKDRPNMIIRMGPDSISTKSISAQYSRALSQSGIDPLFSIRHLRIPPEEFRTSHWLPGNDEGDHLERRPRFFRDSLITDRVRINPVHVYAAVFPNNRLTIIKQITPQIAFSLFLTFMMVTSFMMMYRSMRKQEQLMSMKNDFISNVTHELKTPMATVSVALEALKNFDVLQNTDKTKEYIGIAQNELNRLSLMTDKILKTAVFESQGIAFVPEKILVSNIIRMVLDSMKLVLEKKHITAKFDDSGSGIPIEGSEMHITNVIYNLIDNAVKYSHSDSLIEITFQETADAVEFSITDHGIGIPKEYQSRIFDKFFRVPTGDVHNTKGYGLGLNYVAEVIKSHKGTIKVTSEGGQGSIFSITIPKVHGSN